MSKSNENWFEKVEEFIAQGMPADKAILKVKVEYPGLMPSAGECFEDKVIDNYCAGSRGVDAFTKAKTDYPGLYQNWLNRLKRGETKDLFPK
jgi:hypothetical protein